MVFTGWDDISWWTVVSSVATGGYEVRNSCQDIRPYHHHRKNTSAHMWLACSTIVTAELHIVLKILPLAIFLWTSEMQLFCSVDTSNCPSLVIHASANFLIDKTHWQVLRVVWSHCSQIYTTSSPLTAVYSHIQAVCTIVECRRSCSAPHEMVQVLSGTFHSVQKNRVTFISRIPA